MRVFIGGVMQGSRNDHTLEDQGYRERIAAALRARWPEAQIIDPVQLHPESPGYDDAMAKETLFAMAELARQSDAVIAYLPAASMGTALEMYLAHQNGVPVLAITPMAQNWVVRALATHVFPDLDAFLVYVASATRLGA
jgi:nucleoside 2-deoxyribosyltransferase